jgi:hypothetical protein
MIPIEQLLLDHQGGHGNLQVERLIVVRSGQTVYGCYRQSLRELWKRWRGLRELYASRELALIDIEQIEQQKCDNDFDSRRVKIHVATKRLAVIELDRNIEDTERELMRFWEIASSLKEQIGELTPEKRDELDTEMWHHQILGMAATDFLSSGSLSPNTITMLQSLEPEQRVVLCEKIFPKKPDDGTIEKLSHWFMTDSPKCKLAPTGIESVDLKRLVQDGPL